MEKGEEEQIGEDLERLFAFQDRNLSKDKKSILVKSLLESGLPTGAILLGIRSLMNDDLSAIKMGHIFYAIRMFIEPTDYGDCDQCSEGFIISRDENGRWFALACNCIQGSLRKKNGLVSWSGDERQFLKGRILIKQDCGCGN